ncbi:hypothetical protein PGR6_37120 [Pseudomonas sp. GR 6-02]|nr:hypothetical protein PGR6_37120 [Pseudomonas sp. GR 6-02]
MIHDDPYCLYCRSEACVASHIRRRRSFRTGSTLAQVDVNVKGD